MFRACIYYIIAFGILGISSVSAQNYKVKVTFSEASPKQAFNFANLKVLKKKCSGNEILKRNAKWKCKKGKSLGYACYTYVSCMSSEDGFDRREQISKLSQKYKSFPNKLVKGDVRIKLGRVKRAPAQSNSKKNVVAKIDKKKEDQVKLRKRGSCTGAWCYSKVGFAGTRVASGESALFTTNFSWFPSYTIDNNWSVEANIGGHMLTDSSDESFLVYEFGGKLLYTMEKTSLMLGTGSQIWNDTAGNAYDYMQLGFQYNFKEPYFAVFDQLSATYLSMLGEEISEIRIGLNVLF